MCRTEPEAATETRLFEEKLPPQLARLRALKPTRRRLCRQGRGAAISPPEGI